MKDGELTILDILNIMSFFIGLMNLQENLTQGDKQELMSETDKQTSIILKRDTFSFRRTRYKIRQIIKKIGGSG